MTAVPPARLRFRRDSALSSLAARGDPTAFAAVYERHHQALYRYCRSILHNDEDARDALQSTMMRAFAALRTEERDFELRPWLFRIAHNEAISLLRRRRETHDVYALEHAGEETLDRQVAQREELATLRIDLAALSEQQRSALVLRELNGLGHDEIAIVLGVTPSAVKAAIFDARSALHEYREGRAMTCDSVQRVLSDRDGRALRGRKLRAHLRACRGCQDFLVGLERRPATLAALAPPLPAAASAALLAHLLPVGGKTAFVAGASGSTTGGGGAAVVGGASGSSGVVGAAGVSGSTAASGGVVAAGAGTSASAVGAAGLAASTAASGGIASGLAVKVAVTALVAAGATGGAVVATRPDSPPTQRPASTAPVSPTTGSGEAVPAAPAGGASPSAKPAPAHREAPAEPRGSATRKPTSQASPTTTNGRAPAQDPGAAGTTPAPAPAPGTTHSRPTRAPAGAPAAPHSSAPGRPTPVRRPREHPRGAGTTHAPGRPPAAGTTPEHPSAQPPGRTTPPGAGTTSPATPSGPAGPARPEDPSAAAGDRRPTGR